MTFTVALVGYGMAGQIFHGPQLAAIGAQVCDIVVRNPERVKAAQRDFPQARIRSSFAEFLSGDRPDLIVLGTPNALHAEHAIAALQAGVRVVTDKPMAASLAEAQQMLAVSIATGVGLTVYQNRRWDAQHLTLQRLIGEGILGEVFRYERRYERFRPIPKNRWKENDAVGGGLLLDLGPHMIDNALQLFGPAERVYAEARARTTPAVDDVFIALTHASGVISHLQAGGVVGAPGPAVRVLGDKGSFLVTAYDGEPTPFAHAQPPPEYEGWFVTGEKSLAVPGVPSDPTAFYRAVAAWIDGGPVPVDPADGVATQEILELAARSAETGEVVTVPVDNAKV